MFFISFCTPIILHTLASHACPIKPVGAVNTSNTFTFIDAIFCRDAKAILKASQDKQLTYTSKFGGSEMQGHRRKRGVECSIDIQIKREDKVVLEIKSSFLQFLPRKHLPLYKDDQQESSVDFNNVNDKSSAIISPLFMSARHPTKWAANCSDYNPIHISPLAAKFFGFSSVIAHGNHVIALALQDVLEDDQKGTVSAKAILTREQFSLQVRFVKPVLLPADLKVKWQAQAKDQFSIEVRNKEDKVCLVGQLEM